MSRIVKVAVRQRRGLSIGVGKRGPAGKDGAATLPTGQEGQVLGYGPGGVPVAVDPSAGGALYDDAPITQRVAALETAPPSHTHDWASLAGKPGTFAPSDHGHAISDVAGLSAALADMAPALYVHAWSEIADKPTTFAPAPHRHDASEIDNLPAVSPATAWADLTGVPASFPPDAHGHAVGDVDGLQGALDGSLLAIPVRTAAPVRPASDRVAVYPRRRAGYDFLEMLRASGRDLALQPHMGLNRVGMWTPNGASVANIGINPGTVGTLSAPALNAANLASSCVRFRLASAATAAQAAEYRGSQPNLWRGNAPGLGGFLAVFRIAVVTLVAGCNGFFGLTSTGNLVNPLEVATWGGQLVGLGFKEGVHANWQLVAGAGNGSNTLIDLGTNFPVNDPAAMLTLYLYSPPNGASIFARVVNEATGRSFDAELTAGIPAPNMFLSPRIHMDNGPTTAAVALDCFGVYVEADY